MLTTALFADVDKGPGFSAIAAVGFPLDTGKMHLK